jgi:prepilin-type N-terminal cleavage/methylation domain-containing protein
MHVNRQKKQNRLGFTLIELLAVIMIAGLLAAISVPTFRGILKGSALNTAASSLTNTLSLARQMSIAFRYVYRVELDDELEAAERSDNIDDSLQEQRYRIYYARRDARDPDNPTEEEKVTVQKWRLLPKFVEFDDDNSLREVCFKPTGGANGRDDSGKYFFWFEYKFTIVHTESGTQGKEKGAVISVDGITGKVRSDTATVS